MTHSLSDSAPEDPHGVPEIADPESAAEAFTPRKGHPPGLWVLFITEMWERFSYYGMRALLVLYLIASTSTELQDGSTNDNPGFGWQKDSAYVLYGIYTWAVYLTPLIGGWLADRFLGTHRSMLIGGWIIAAGHLTLALTESFGITAGKAVTLQTGPGALICFLTGLVLIIIGTGFFKPCVSVMVGQLYGQGDPRRDSGFTIFYMGINLGALMSPLVAGTLGEKVGWHWGFGAAAVGMLAGLGCYQLLRPKYLAGIGLPPGEAEYNASENPDDSDSESAQAPMTSVEWQRIAVILILAVIGNVFFWTAFEQAGSSMNVFAATETDLTFGGLLEGEGFPATWYQSANPASILVFAPVFAWLWVWLGRRGLNPSTPMKFAFGLYFLGLAFLAMVAGAFQARGENLAGAHWLFITYVVYTWGELCLSPVGLSMVTKLAPPRLQSMMMGVWFFSFSVANLLAGLVAAFSTRMDTTVHMVELEKGKAYADVSYNATEKELRVKLLQGDMETPFFVTADEIPFSMSTRSEDGWKQPTEVVLTAKREENKSEETASQFVLSGDAVPAGVDDIEDIQGEFKISVIEALVETDGKKSQFIVSAESMPRGSGELESIELTLIDSKELEEFLNNDDEPIVRVEEKELEGKLVHDHYTFLFEGLPGFYLMLVVIPLGAGLLITLLTPVLKRMMHGVE